jgi:guanine deaminase
MDMQEHHAFMGACLEAACTHVASGAGGPFAALVVKDGEIIGRGVNRVTTHLDPTAHAEVEAIRDACRNTGDFRLEGATLYSSCEPCPMCLGAIYWAHINMVIYGADRLDAMRAGFDDAKIYEEIPLTPSERTIRFKQLIHPENNAPFNLWLEQEHRTEY